MKLKSIEKLYHGSDKKFESIDLKYANAFKDYGKGFYLTSNYKQAQKWAQQKPGIKQLHISIATT